MHTLFYLLTFSFFLSTTWTYLIERYHTSHRTNTHDNYGVITGSKQKLMTREQKPPLTQHVLAFLRQRQH